MKCYNISDKLAKLDRISVTTMAVIVEGALLLISLAWILIRKLPVLKNIIITPGAFMTGLVAGLLIVASGGIFYIIDKTFFSGGTRRVMEGYVYPLFKDITPAGIIIIALLSGICEEIFFRGVLMAEFGLILASIIFGLLHTPGTKTWFLGAWTALIGVVMALLYKSTGNLFVPIVAHTVNNLIAISYVRYFQPAPPEAAKEETGEYEDGENAEEDEETGIGLVPSKPDGKSKSGRLVTENDSEFVRLKREAEQILQFHIKEEIGKVKSELSELVEDMKGLAQEFKEEFVPEHESAAPGQEPVENIVPVEAAGPAIPHEAPKTATPVQILDPGMVSELEEFERMDREKKELKESGKVEESRITLPEPEYDSLLGDIDVDKLAEAAITDTPADQDRNARPGKGQAKKNKGKKPGKTGDLEDEA